ncbi:MAG: NUDIX hydrolase [Magnetococcales bacterium]|nr:NUDIX hydrolase [Magnetococcales bacterium]
MTTPVIRPCGIAIRDRSILVMRYRYGQNDRFNLPGGNLEPGETLHDCLRREFREELHWTITPQELLHLAETRTDRATLHVVFRVTFTGEPCLDPQQVKATELLWMPLADLSDAPLYPAIGAELAAWLKGHPAPIHLGPIEQPWFR